jgi:hypothetical protein
LEWWSRRHSQLIEDTCSCSRKVGGINTNLIPILCKVNSPTGANLGWGGVLSPPIVYLYPIKQNQLIPKLMTNLELFLDAIKYANDEIGEPDFPVAENFKVTSEMIGHSTFNADIIADEWNLGIEACFKKLSTLCDISKLRAMVVEFYDVEYEFTKIDNGFKGRYHEFNPREMELRKCKLEDMEFYLIKCEDGDLEIIIADPSIFQ